MSNTVPAATSSLRARDILAAIKRVMPIAGPGILVRQTTAGSIISCNAKGGASATAAPLLPFTVRTHTPTDGDMRAEIYLPTSSYTAESPYVPLNERAEKYHEGDDPRWYDLGDIAELHFIDDYKETTTLDDGTVIEKTPAYIYVFALPGGVLIAQSYVLPTESGYDENDDFVRCAYVYMTVAAIYKTKTTPAEGEATTTYAVEQFISGAVQKPPPDNMAYFRLKYTLEDTTYAKRIKKVEVDGVLYQCGGYTVLGEEDSYEVEYGEDKVWVAISHPPMDPTSDDPPLFEVNVETGSSVPRSTDAETDLQLYDMMNSTFAGEDVWFPTFDYRDAVLGVPFYT